MDAVLGALNNPIVLTAITLAWGLLIKFHPAFAKIPNMLIPYLNGILALVIKLAEPSVAHAQAAVGTPVDTHCILCAVGAAGWQAILSSLIFEVFMRHPLNAVVQKQP